MMQNYSGGTHGGTQNYTFMHKIKGMSYFYIKLIALRRKSISTWVYLSAVNA